MNMKAILKTMVKGFVMSLMILGVLAISANAQKNDQRKFNYRLSKQKIKFATPVLDLSAGRIVVSGTVKGVEVSGGSGGCFTITLTTYRFTPTGEKIPVRSRSRRLCKIERLPDIVVERVPRGKYLVEIAINRPLIREENIVGEIEVRVEPERAGLR